MFVVLERERRVGSQLVAIEREHRFLHHRRPVRSHRHDCSRCLSAVLLRPVVRYVSSTAEDPGLRRLAAGLRRLPALRQEDVDGEVRPQPARALALHEHGGRARRRRHRDAGGRTSSRSRPPGPPAPACGPRARGPPAARSRVTTCEPLSRTGELRPFSKHHSLCFNVGALGVC